MAHPPSAPHRHDLLVLRHGETLWNREGRMQGGLDSGLTPLGRAQSRRMSEALAAAGVGGATHVALTSPQGRALETARLALDPLGLAASPEPLLREVGMGAWAGLAADEIALGWPGPAGEAVLDFYARAPGGEGLDALWDRMGALLARLDGPAVVVTHGMTSRFLRCRALGWPPARLADLPGGQGLVHRVRGGEHLTLGLGPLAGGERGG